MYTQKRFFLSDQLLIDSAAVRVRLKVAVDIGKGLERIAYTDSPIKATVESVIFIHRNIGDNITDLHVHILDILQKLLHF
jgi:hypothetical protein